MYHFQTLPNGAHEIINTIIITRRMLATFKTQTVIVNPEGSFITTQGVWNVTQLCSHISLTVNDTMRLAMPFNKYTVCIDQHYVGITTRQVKYKTHLSSIHNIWTRLKSKTNCNTIEERTLIKYISVQSGTEIQPLVDIRAQLKHTYMY